MQIGAVIYVVLTVDSIATAVSVSGEINSQCNSVKFYILLSGSPRASIAWQIPLICEDG